MKVDLDKLIKYEINKRDLFIKFYTEKIQELNGNIFEELKQKIIPYESVLEKLNALTGKDQEDYIKTKEAQEALAILSDAEKLKGTIIVPDLDEDFLFNNLTISKEELKQYLYN